MLHTLPTDAAMACMRLSLSTTAPSSEHCSPRARHTVSQLSPAGPSTHGRATVAVADGDVPVVCVRVGVLLIVIGVRVGRDVEDGLDDTVAVVLAVGVAV